MLGERCSSTRSHPMYHGREPRITTKRTKSRIEMKPRKPIPRRFEGPLHPAQCSAGLAEPVTLISLKKRSAPSTAPSSGSRTFECDAARLTHVAGEENGRHAAATNLALDLVAALRHGGELRKTFHAPKLRRRKQVR